VVGAGVEVGVGESVWPGVTRVEVGAGSGAAVQPARNRTLINKSLGVRSIMGAFLLVSLMVLSVHYCIKRACKASNRDEG
jgi:hypothetical protein